MLTPGVLASEMEAFMLATQQMKQEDAKVAIHNYCDSMEKAIYNAIRNVQITIPSGMIQTVGGNGGGPVTCVNVAPIIIQGTLV